MPHRAIEDAATLRRVLNAMLLIEADLDLPVLLRHVVEVACSMTGARFGALGVLDEDHSALAEFITVGLGPDEVAQIGTLPTGKGVLGVLIADPMPLRLARIDSHVESYGFPPRHPPMTSFLGVPIKVRDEVYGNLYLTDKVGWSEFTREDEALVGALAVAAGIAIENARLHQRVQEVAVHDERDRMARDLHDTVIQRLFGAGLRLQGIAGAVREADIARRMGAVVTEIDESITQLRSIIYALGLAGGERDIRAKIITLLRDLAEVVGFEVRSAFDGAVDSAISDEIAEHLLIIVREAVTNIGRHAHATEATVRVSVDADHCQLTVTDNGRGMGAGKTREGGLGLANMRRRAEKLRGSFNLESPPSGGTSLTWRVPTLE
ncbi:MAG: GAF domain-containing sensor histidine kinase [Acidimicrobiales bacterium]|jgi:signal transduction histidine kinase